MKKDRRIDKTQQSIREALVFLLSTKKKSQLTVKELAEVANINRKTFYLHYANIDDVFNTLENEILEKLLLVLERYDFDSNFDINSFFQSINEVIYDDFELYDKLANSDSHEFLSTKVKLVLKNTILEKYTSKNKSDLTIFEYYAEYISSGIMSMYVMWFNSEKYISLEELGAAAARLYFSSFSEIIK